jgi:uncharacterized protein YyaL (SSP411 family)
MSGKETLVQWREWNEAAFQEAKDQDKPILLDIGAVWCHWCHVMDDGIPGDPVHTGSYGDRKIAAFINDHYIPIKVDTDRRPDVNARYNMGGWPTTAFLTPNGDTLYGETYVTPNRMIGLLQYVSEYYRTKKDEIAAEVAKHKQAISATPTSAEQTSDLSSEMVREISDSLKASFDFAYGGFGTQPKFPHPEALAFAVEQSILNKDSELKLVAEKTLDAMSDGGMYDKYAGGFFRYSTTRDWNIPHYEKMLQDNTRLSQVCFEAYRAFQEDHFKNVGLDVHKWLFDVMYDQKLGVFAGSQDADKEEAYYGLPLDKRAELPTPYIDRTIYLDWNALAVSSLVARYKITSEVDILQAAERAYKFLMENVSPRHFYTDSRAQGETDLLQDRAALLDAALDLYESSGSQDYLADAQANAQIILTILQDDTAGGFWDKPVDPNGLGALSEPRKDLTQNADTALALLRLAAFTEDTVAHEAAKRALAFFSDDYRKYSFMAAGYGRAVQAFLGPFAHVVIVGDLQDSRLSEMRQAAWQVYVPFIAIEARSPDRAGDYPATPDGSPRAYVCIGTNCQVADSIENLQKLLTLRDKGIEAG